MWKKRRNVLCERKMQDYWAERAAGRKYARGIAYLYNPSRIVQ
jgi:hypothetical protein